MTDAMVQSLKDAVVEMKFDATEELCRKSLDAGLDPLDILNKALIPALDIVGNLFREEEYFLPDVLMAVKAYNNVYAVLEPLLKKGDYKARGVILLGTVAGDIHEIGKNVLKALLQGNGFDVIDLGVDVAPETFLAKAKEINPDIIGMSALLSTTMPCMKEVLDLFSQAGIRDRFKFIIGGAPISQRYAHEIGADGYGEDAQAGVELAKRLTS